MRFLLIAGLLALSSLALPGTSYACGGRLLRGVAVVVTAPGRAIRRARIRHGRRVIFFHRAARRNAYRKGY